MNNASAEDVRRLSSFDSCGFINYVLCLMFVCNVGKILSDNNQFLTDGFHEVCP